MSKDQAACHSERSEESHPSVENGNGEILRFAQNDKRKGSE